MTPYLEYFMLSECGVPLANLLRVLHVLNQAGGRDRDAGGHTVDLLAWPEIDERKVNTHQNI